MKERGAALVEAAIILPFLILLVLGTIDIARAFFDAAKIQEAAQEGAIYAATHPKIPLDTIQRTEETISTPDITGSVVVTCPATDQVTVTVSYTFNMITPIVRNIIGPNLNLTHSETSRVLSDDACEGFPP